MSATPNDPVPMSASSCPSCGVILDVLDEASVCPECGSAIGSVERESNVDAISLSALRRIRRGVALFAAGVVLVAISTSLVVFTVAPTVPGVAALIGIPLLIMQAGWWEIAAPDRQTEEHPWTGSPALRALTVLLVIAVSTLAVLIIRAPGGMRQWWLSETNIILSVIIAFLFAARTIFFGRLLDRLGERIDAPALRMVGYAVVRGVIFPPLLAIPILLVILVIGAMLYPNQSGTGHITLGIIVGAICLVSHVGSVLWLGGVTSARIGARRATS